MDKIQGCLVRLIECSYTVFSLSKRKEQKKREVSKLIETASLSTRAACYLYDLFTKSILKLFMEKVKSSVGSKS